MLEIMTASAGSGKTYNLVLNYIRLLLGNQDRFAYRHILAVTFTNKATDEMKCRILLELHKLATSVSTSPYRNVFVPSLFKTETQLQKKSETILRDILHDYSAFSVSTIDKFFQQTLKAFSKEIGQFASYQVELDKESLIAESVDRILDSLTAANTELLSWLTQNVLEQIESGEKYSLEKNLRTTAGRLKSNQRKDALQLSGINEEKAYSIDNLNKIRTACRQLVSDFREMVVSVAGQCLKDLDDACVDPMDSSYKFMKAFYQYAELAPSVEVPYPSDTFMKYSADRETWFPKKNRKISDMLGSALDDSMERFRSLFISEYPVYKTAYILDRQIYGLGIAGALNKAFNEVMKEKNVLCIDDSNTILRDIIDGSDAPFIYEKTGVRYDHFLLDEFQDTAQVQWQNFKPLLEESDGRGGSNLIVGDVKQSIYRWRGSDWELLNTEVPEEFPLHTINPLETNWRSLGNVVRFNNEFFSAAVDVLSATAGDKYGSLSDIYADVRQQISKEPESGSVSLTFCDVKDELKAVLSSIREVCAKGAEYKDIAVLVRSNSSGQQVAEYLAVAGIPIVTDESLKVKNSVTVRRIVSLMSLADNPNDTVRSYLATSLNVVIPEKFNSLTDLAESLLRRLKETDGEGLWKREVLHIQSFFDFLQDYVSSDGNDLRGFLRYFEEKDPPICSPSSGNSVRIMTIHKSKGLDFKYVILPFAENICFYKQSQYWSVPDLKGTRLEGIAEGVYDVNLSSSASQTLFSDSYEKEKFLQMVDNMNILYVAMTRPVLGMHIISKSLPGTCLKALEQGDCSCFKDFSQVLWWFATRTEGSLIPDGNSDSVRCTRGLFDVNVTSDLDFEVYDRYDYGSMVDFSRYIKEEQQIRNFPLSEFGELPSFPLNPDDCDSNEPVQGRGRLKFSADSIDFFSGDELPSIDSSKRIKGVVLHDILSRIISKDDLDSSISLALANGEVTSQEAVEIRNLLGQRLSEAAAYGWFPEKSEGAEVLNECSILDTDGREYRPDRVVIKDGEVIIIDYKTGVYDDKYEEQIHRYADIWKRMGYSDVSSVLWYIQSGEFYKVD